MEHVLGRGEQGVERKGRITSNNMASIAAGMGPKFPTIASTPSKTCRARASLASNTSLCLLATPAITTDITQFTLHNHNGYHTTHIAQRQPRRNPPPGFDPGTQSNIPGTTTHVLRWLPAARQPAYWQPVFTLRISISTVRPHTPLGWNDRSIPRTERSIVLTLPRSSNCNFEESACASLQHVFFRGPTRTEMRNLLQRQSLFHLGETRTLIRGEGGEGA
jgi:hypothetical protein